MRSTMRQVELIAPYKYAVAHGSLPVGTELDEDTGIVYGVVTTQGIYCYTIQATDSGETPYTAVCMAPVTAYVAPVLSISATSQAGPMFTGDAFLGDYAALGGVPPYTFTVIDGALPVGTMLNAQRGIVSGVPTKAGDFDYTIMLEDSAGHAITKKETGTLLLGLSLIATESELSQVNREYLQENAAVGGVPPYTLSIASGNLPNGTEFDEETGIVSGIPSEVEDYSYTIQVTDSSIPARIATAVVSGTINDIVCSVMGDSTAWQGTSGSTGNQYNINGIFYWLLKQTNYRVSCPIANNLGVAGSYIDQARTVQVPLLDSLTDLPTDLFLLTGTNDLGGGSPLETMKSQYTSLILSILAKPYIKRLWIVPITPRSNAMTSILYNRRLDFNAWLADLLLTPATYIAAGLTSGDVKRLRVLDVGFATDVDGNTPKEGYVVTDGLHHNTRMAQGLALQASQYMNSVIAENPPRRTTSSDLYNASTNPTGTMLNNGGLNRGFLLGTSGNKTTYTGITPTGSVADKWRLYRTEGSGGATLVASKEGVRPSGADGQIITYTISGAGPNNESIVWEYLGQAFGIDPGDGIVTGAPVWFEGEFEILSNNGILKDVNVYMYEQGNASNKTVKDGTSTSVEMKLPTGALGPYWFRTPLLLPQANTTHINPSIKFGVDASGGIGSFSVVLRDVIVHQPYV